MPVNADSILGNFFKPLAFGMAGADFVAITQFIGNPKASPQSMYEMIIALPLLVLAGVVCSIHTLSFEPRNSVTVLAFTALTMGWIGSFWGLGTIFAAFNKGFGTAFTIVTWSSVALSGLAFKLAANDTSGN